MASLTQWTWVWVNSGSWWWTGRPGVLWFMGSQRVGRDWATELNCGLCVGAAIKRYSWTLDFKIHFLQSHFQNPWHRVEQNRKWSAVFIKGSVLHCKVADLNTGAGELFIDIIPWIPGQWLPLMISEETDFTRLGKELAMLDFMGNCSPTVYTLEIFKDSLYLNFN